MGGVERTQAGLQTKEVTQRVFEVIGDQPVGDGASGLSPHNQPATTEAGEMVGKIRLRHFHPSKKLRGSSGTIKECQKHLLANWLRQREAHTGQG